MKRKRTWMIEAGNPFNEMSVKLTAPGILNLQEDLVQVTEKTTPGVDPVSIIHEEHIEQTPIGPAQSSIQAQ